MKTLFLSGMPGSVEDNRHGPQTAVVFPRRRIGGEGRGVGDWAGREQQVE